MSRAPQDCCGVNDETLMMEEIMLLFILEVAMMIAPVFKMRSSERLRVMIYLQGSDETASSLYSSYTWDELGSPEFIMSHDVGLLLSACSELWFWGISGKLRSLKSGRLPLTCKAAKTAGIEKQVIVSEEKILKRQDLFPASFSDWGSFMNKYVKLHSLSSPKVLLSRMTAGFLQLSVTKHLRTRSVPP